MAQIQPTNKGNIQKKRERSRVTKRVCGKRILISFGVDKTTGDVVVPIGGTVGKAKTFRYDESHFSWGGNLN